MFIKNMSSEERSGAEVRRKFQLDCHKEIQDERLILKKEVARSVENLNTGSQKKHRRD